jgi:hypothetical protein
LKFVQRAHPAGAEWPTHQRARAPGRPAFSIITPCAKNSMASETPTKNSNPLPFEIN